MTNRWGSLADEDLAAMIKVSSDLTAYVQGLFAFMNGDRQAGFTAEREAKLAEALAGLTTGIARRAVARRDAASTYQRQIWRALIGAAAGGWMFRADLAELCGGDTTAFTFAVDDMIRGDLIESQREKFVRHGPEPRTSYRITEAGRLRFGIDHELTPGEVSKPASLGCDDDVQR